uniref:HTH OST-type domain-containing protein n=1 Tax=Timema tahoe TaxID=61484 RepID=A0A7R9FLN4_9NEOP|nr:unnamed protein product [Timema tahoe]
MLRRSNIVLTLSPPTITLPPTTTHVAGTSFCSTKTNVAGTLVSEHNVAVVMTSTSYPQSCTRKLRHNSRSDDENVLSQSPRAPRPIMSGLNVLNSIPTPNVFSNLAWNPGFAGAHHSGFGSLMNFQDVSVPPPVIEAAVKGWENGTHQSQLTGSLWNPSVPMASQRVLTNSGRGLGESFHDAAPGRFRTIKGTHGGLQSSRHGNTNQELNSAGAMPIPSCHLVNGTNPSILKRCRTSSPTADLHQIQTPAVFGFPFPLKRRSPSPYTVLEAETDVLGENSQHFFHPIAPSKTELLTASVNSSIQLIVTNLDQTIEPKEMKRVLLALFREHVMVIHISVFTQTDGNVAAHVKVPSLQDAQYAISRLHRRKVGFKRMLIAYAHGGGPSPQLIRSQIVSLLLEVPGHSLPLFKFRELFESRYLTSISVSDMYKMKDVCIIREDPSGRMVSLNPDHRNTPSPSFGVGTQDGQLDLPYCTLHPQRPGAGKGWAEQDLEALPNFRIGLNILAERIHTLLHSHNGSLPLPSLPNCYQVQFNKLEEDKDGVPLEHLVSCLPGIEIYQGVGCVKYLRWTKVKPNTESQSEELKCVSPPLATQLALFSRELVDLLKTSPHCLLLFNRFIPAYHHHFGRQCRVADYGFTKLIELMEALPNIVQVMGEGNKRVVTLSHHMQVRRFCSDLLRVLKSQATKHVLLAEFPKAYQRVLNKPWDIVDYGVCEMEDLLSELPENSVVVFQQENDVAISIPKREQTLEEIEKTKQFSGEVVELMRHAPQCSMLFSKFIPAYHHHFGHQCRVSDFGFTKLIELFEAIPEVVKVRKMYNILSLAVAII